MKRFARVFTFLALTSAPALAQVNQVPAVDQSLAAYASSADSVRLADGRSIHFVCMGRGSPTVILTAGLGDWGSSWSAVQPAIARTTRACAWDRPGFGLSDATTQSQSAATMTADLEAALQRGRVGGPYVLVGHSLGAFESLLFADRHASQVAGMVLVDPAVPDQAALMKRVAPTVAASSDAYTTGLIALVRRCAAELRSATAARGGSTSPDCELPFSPTYPTQLITLLKAEAAKPAQGEAVASFYENVGLSGVQVINPTRNYGAMPLIVLTATEAQRPPPDATPEATLQTSAFLEAFGRAHDALAALSTRGVNARVPGSSHYIQQIKPQVVIDAINAVVAEARASKP